MGDGERGGGRFRKPRRRGVRHAPRAGTSTPRRGRRPSGRGTGSPRRRRDYLSRLPVQRVIEGGALLVHGAPSEPGRYVDSIDHAAQELSTLFASVATGPIFFGHTHEAGGFVRRVDGRVEPVPAKEFRLLPGERALLNPGSVGQPRDRDRDASFLLFDTVDGTVTWVRVPYDVEAARRKVLEAGLPREFAERLRDGT